MNTLINGDLIARVERVKNDAVLLLEALYWRYPDLRHSDNPVGESTKGIWNAALHPRGQPHNSGQYIETPLHKAIWECIDKLLPYARDGKMEAAFLLDADTGQVLGFTEGQEDRVDMEVEAELRNLAWVHIHNHPNVMPPSDDDWKALAEHPNLMTIIATDKERAYWITKDHGGYLTRFSGAESEEVKRQFMIQLGDRLLEHGYDGNSELTEAELYPLVLQTNHWMCENYKATLHIKEHE